MPGEDLLALADRLLAAVERGDLETVAASYDPEATIWHNFDDVAQSVPHHLRVLRWMHRNVPDRRYDVQYRGATADGRVVQQHVLRGTAPDGTSLAVSACILLTFDDSGRVTRLEEYLDSAQLAPLLGRTAR